MGIPNKAKGEFRPIYESLPDHPKFQCMQAPARLLLYVLKNTMGATGIQIAYPAVLSEQTGLPVDIVELAAQELERAGWIRREWKVWWLVDGLEHEPNMSMKNDKHRTYVLNQIQSLPRLQIVVDFLARYGLDDPDPDGETIAPEYPDSNGYGIGYRMGYESNGYGNAYTEPSPSPSPSPSHTKPPSSTTSPVVETKTAPETERRAGLEENAEPTAHASTGTDERTDALWAEIAKKAHLKLGLGKLSYRDEARNRDILTTWRYKKNRDPWSVLAAIEGACLLRREGGTWLEVGTSYTLAALVKAEVVADQGDGTALRPLFAVAEDRWRKHEAGEGGRRSRDGPTLIADILGLDKGAA
jgi:hypothetical protein